MIWSFVLMAVGVTGLYLAGKRNYWGWGIGLAAQALWAAYAITTAQWGFLISAFVYGFVYAKNFFSWSPGDILPGYFKVRAGRRQTIKVDNGTH